MRSELPQTFATLRIVGDDLIPEQVTKFLKLVPTVSYAKGEYYSAGKRGGQVLGRTGLWYLSTDGIVASGDLNDHLHYILSSLLGGARHTSNNAAIFTANVLQFKKFVDRQSLKIVITCFWYGQIGSKRPVVRRIFKEIFDFIGAEMELDFDTDEPPLSDAELTEA
jgi:hypothetical protein